MADTQQSIARLQELLDQRIGLVWLLVTAVASEQEKEDCEKIRQDILNLDKQIKELQNG